MAIIKEYTYFFFSNTQKGELSDLYKKMNNDKYIPNKVFVNGDWKPYTESNKTGIPSFKDSKLIAKGENMQIKEMNE